MLLAGITLTLALTLMVTVIILTKKNVVDVSLFIFGSLGLAGISFGVFERTQGFISVSTAQVSVALSFLLVMLYMLFSSRSKLSALRSRRWLIPVIIGIIITLLVSARWQAMTLTPNLLSGAGRLAFPEDNARWIHFSSNIAQGNPLSLTEGVSGGVAALLIIASAIAQIYVTLVNSGTNIPAQTIQTVLMSHNLLLILAPLSVSALVASVWLGRLRSMSRFWFFNRNLWLTYGIFLGVMIVTLSVGATLAVGHMTLEFTIILLAFWASFTIHFRHQSRHLVLITVVGSSVAIAWLPMPYVAIVIAATGLFSAFTFRKRIRSSSWWTMLALLAMNFATTIWFSLNFVSTTASPSSRLGGELIVAEGGTRSVELYEFILLMAALATLIGLFLRFGRRRPMAYLYRFYPVVLLLGYSGAVLAYDFFVSPEGWPHYGARKLTYALVLISVAAVLPLTSRLLTDKTTALRTLSFFSLAAISAVLATTSTAKSGAAQFTSNVWANFDQQSSVASDAPHSWVHLANPQTGAQTLAGYPIACFQVNDNDALVSGTLNPHICTRFLIGMHGIEPRAWNIFSAMIAGNEVWEDSYSELKYLDTQFGSRPVLRIDEAGIVEESISLSQFLRRVNPGFS